MNHRNSLILLALLLIALGFVQGGWYWLAFWPGSNFLAYGIAHACGWHGIFGKRQDGTLPIWSWVVFFPLLTYTWAVWHLARVLFSEPAYNTVADDLVIGRRLRSAEINLEFQNFIDLTAEFMEPHRIRQCSGYRSFSVLDGSAPTTARLQEFLLTLPPGRTFIHCAQGHGRTGLVAIAWMLQAGMVESVEAGLRKLKAVRPAVNLSKSQLRCVHEFQALLKAAKTRGEISES